MLEGVSEASEEAGVNQRCISLWGKMGEGIRQFGSGSVVDELIEVPEIRSLERGVEPRLSMYCVDFYSLEISCRSMTGCK